MVPTVAGAKVNSDAQRAEEIALLQDLNLPVVGGIGKEITDGHAGAGQNVPENTVLAGNPLPSGASGRGSGISGNVFVSKRLVLGWAHGVWIPVLVFRWTDQAVSLHGGMGGAGGWSSAGAQRFP